MQEEKEMSFLDHLEELRWRLVRSAIAILVISIVLWMFKGWIMQNLFIGMSKPDFITYQKFCQWFSVCVEEIRIKEMQSFTMSGQFSYALMMSIIGAIVIAFPYIFYQIWSFVKPGLKTKEKSIAKGIIFYVSALFFTGILFGYFVVAPLCVQFFGNFRIVDEIQNNFTINSYMSTILSTVFYTGLLFLLPVVTYIMVKLGVINAAFLRKYRKHSIIGVLILAAVITPPDLISQVIVAIPIAILYEAGILVAVKIEKKANEEETTK
ncbi:MAG: sec-independent protein translocase protein TatC [Psychromonas sp.]|jgi:sec-independent protein translocase protein TatC